MNYKYELACKESGLEKETLAKIRKVFNTDIKRLQRENERMKESGFELLYYEQSIDANGEKRGFDLADEAEISMNPEHILIQQFELALLQKVLRKLPRQERSFILACYKTNKTTLADVGKLYHMSETKVDYRKKKLLEKVTMMYFEEENA